MLSVITSLRLEERDLSRNLLPEGIDDLQACSRRLGAADEGPNVF